MFKSIIHITWKKLKKFVIKVYNLYSKIIIYVLLNINVYTLLLQIILNIFSQNNTQMNIVYFYHQNFKIMQQN